MKYPAMCCVSLFFIASACYADSLRCGSDLLETGDTKVEVTAKCGKPVATDTFCKLDPVRVNPTNQVNAYQGGNNNIQQNIIVQPCRNVDVWTYNQGAGSFLKILYFSEGKLWIVENGDRT